MRLAFCVAAAGALWLADGGAPRAGGDAGQAVPRTYDASDEVLRYFLQRCKTTRADLDCYNVAVSYAHNGADDGRAIEYLRPLCEKGYGLGCFALGEILIKQQAWRREGIEAFRRACALSKTRTGTRGENEAAARGCERAATVEKYKDLDYARLAEKLGLTAPPADGGVRASFDCAKASTASEKTICSSRELGVLDLRVAESYRQLLASSTNPDAVKAAQRAWVATTRNACADVACLKACHDARVDALAAEVAAANPFPGSFVKVPFIRPEIVDALTASLMNDEEPPPASMSVDVADARASERFFGAAETRARDGALPYVHYTPTGPDNPEDNGAEFGYVLIGRTASGVDVLQTSESGGGSMTGVALLLVRVEQDKAHKNRVVLRRVRQIDLGDRWRGDVTIKGDEIHIGPDRSGNRENGPPGRASSRSRPSRDRRQAPLRRRAVGQRQQRQRGRAAAERADGREVEGPARPVKAQAAADRAAVPLAALAAEGDQRRQLAQQRQRARHAPDGARAVGHQQHRAGQRDVAGDGERGGAVGAQA